MSHPSNRPPGADADLLIAITGHSQSWRVQLLHTQDQSCLAEADVEPIDFEDLRTRFLNPLRHGAIGIQEAESLGRVLASVLFPKGFFARIVRAAQGGPAKIRVHASPPECVALPWEYAYVDLPTQGYVGFVCHFPWIHMIRHVVTDRQKPATRDRSSPGKVRVLLVQANPDSREYPSLPSSLLEVDAVERALNTLGGQRFGVERMTETTPSRLSKRLAQGDVDVIHFVGHSDIKASGGVLVLEGSQPYEHDFVYGDDLAEWCRAAGVRIAVLSGCLSGSPTGVAGKLVSGGVDAVVAMQFPITDTSAFFFSREFYLAIADATGLETALFQGRAATQGRGLDWAIPVLVASRSEAWLVPAPPLEDPEVEPSHNISSDDRQFIGRSKELRALRQLVVTRRKRFVTVTGMGGMGKTRLVRQFGRSATSSFTDGVRLVDCEALENEEELRAAIGAALRYDEGPVTWESLMLSLQDRKMLLILDCFERLVSQTAHLEKLLEKTKHLQLLVTSRIILDSRWEQEFALGTMSLVKRASRTDGLDLFLDAACHADPDFKLTAENRKELDELVSDLEAVPLAIVLAAGRLRHLSLKELHERILTKRLETLTRTRIQEGPERHENLIRVVEDSFQLLREPERSLAFQLSVFRGGFFVEDAFEVLPDAQDLRQGIYALRDNSLLTSQVVDSRMRFRCLDTIRDYVRTVADQKVMALVAKRHAEYFAKRAVDIRNGADQGRLAEANSQLWQDAGNYRTAIQFAIDTNDSVLVRSFASSLARPYFEVGARSDFDLLSIAANRLATLSGDRQLRLELSGLQGALYRREGDLTRARDMWLQRASLAEEAEDLDTFADSMLDVADVALVRGDFDSVEAIVDRVEGFGEQVASLPLRASAMLLRAKVRIERKHLEEAVQLAQQAEYLVAGFHGDRQAMYVWFSLAQIYRTCGSLAASERLCRHMIAEGLATGYTHYMGRGLLELSETLEEASRTQSAGEAIAAALAIPRSTSAAIRQAATKRAKQLSDRYGIHFPKNAGQSHWESLARAFVPEPVTSEVD